MSQIPEGLKYSPEHEWLRLSEDGATAVIGITDYAQSNLGDVTYVELPAAGTSFNKGDVFGVVESVKAASDLYMPVTGEILETNSELEAAPDILNSDPYGAAWMVKVKLDNPSEVEEMLSADGYGKLV